MKKFFGFGSSTPPPPAAPLKPPAPPAKPAPAQAAPAAAKTPPTAPAAGAASIVGRWKEPNGSDTTEFHADGTVTERAASGEMIRGRYSLENGKLKINLDGVPNEIVLTAAVSADALETSDTDGQVTHYRRA